MKVEKVRVKVAALEVCTRSRVRKEAPSPKGDLVEEYADAYRCGHITALLDVFQEKGTERFIVADGEHRLHALRKAKIEEVEVLLHVGDEIDALDFGIGCNQAHGLRRTKADKEYQFRRIMETERLRLKYPTDEDLSAKIGVSKKTISNYKVDWRNSDGGDKKVKKEKARAQQRAAENTKKNAKPLTERPKAKTLTAEQQKIAEQVRASVAPAAKPGTPKPDAKWTEADGAAATAIRHTVRALEAAWKAASLAAQNYTKTEVVAALRSIL